MAVADELLLKVKTDASQAEKAITGWADKVESKAKKAGKAMERAGKKMTIGVTLPLAAAAGKAVQLFTQQEDAVAKLQSTFDSTGAAAWTSVEGLEANAQALQGMTTHGDEAIESMQSVLLTFTQIKGDQFDEATKASLNMADALGMDLQSSAIMVGKALNDPLTGMSAMSRAGITFSQEQKDMVKSMVESGDTMGAQKLILGELETQFGGTSEAIAKTTGGQMKQSMNALGDAAESVGAVLAPMLSSLAGFVKTLAEKFQALSPGMQKAIVIFAGVVAAIGPVLMIVGKLIQMGGMVTKVIKGVGVAMNFVAANPIVLIIAAIVALIAAIVLIIKHWDEVKAFLLKTWEVIKKAFDAFVGFLKKVWDAVWGAIKAVVEAILGAIVDYITVRVNAILKVVHTVTDAIKKVWEAAWGIIKKVAKAVWDAVVGNFIDGAGVLWDAIKGVMETVSDAWEAFTGFLSDTWHKVWDTITDGISDAINGAIGIIRGALNAIIGVLEGAINGAIGLVNKLIEGYNKIPLAPDLPTIPNVSVPRLALGGKVIAAGQALVGERGPEVLSLPRGAQVTPLTGPTAPGPQTIIVQIGDDEFARFALDKTGLSTMRTARRQR